MRRMLLLALALLIVAVCTPLMAAPVGSPYEAAISALSPRHYYPLDEAWALPAGSVASDLGSNPINGTYIVNGNMNNGSQAQNSGLNSYTTTGNSVGPTANTSKFTSEPYNQAFVQANSLPGFNPNLNDPTAIPPDTTTGGPYNASFEANGRGAITLGANTDFLGGTDRAFTVAIWFRHDNTSSFPRLFEAGGADNTADFFQLDCGSNSSSPLSIAVSSTKGKALSAFYPSGAPASVGGDTGAGQGQWYFVVASVYGNTVDERAANIQLWERYADKTNALRGLYGGWGASGQLGVAKIGYREAGPGLSQTVSDKIDEVATWNRVLAYDEKESLYVAATTPTTGAPVNATQADGVWGNAGNWAPTTVYGQVGQWWPLQHGGNNLPYFDVQINNAITTPTISPGDANGTDTFRSNMYRLAVNPSGNLSMNMGTTLRTYEHIAVNGPVAMNGEGGLYSTSPGTKDYNVKKESVLDAGQNVTLAAGSTVTMASPYNVIKAEGNLTIQAGANLVVNAGSYLPTTTGSKLLTIGQANYQAFADSDPGKADYLKSQLGRTGALAGTFNATLNQPADPLGRKLSILYEGAAADGSGTVDSVKIGFARPGDGNFDNNVDVLDVNALVPNFNGTGKNWRQGDYTGEGSVNVLDVNALRPNFNQAYAMSSLEDTNSLKLIYDDLTGDLSILTTPSFLIDGLTIESTAGLLTPGNWNGPNGGPDFFTGTPQVVGFNGMFSGNTVGPSGSLGIILPAGLTTSQLLSDLTVTYFKQGDNTAYTVPEPSTWLLLLVAACGLGLVGLKRRAA